MKWLFFLLLCLPFSILISQSSDHYIIAAQGDFSKGESISLSWTIGDVATESATLDKSIITQGFQQPFITVRELNTSNDPKTLGPGITSRNSNDFSANVFPNPFGTNITINVDNSKQEYYLDIFDPAGNLISRMRSSSPQEVISLYELPASQYVLRISLIESQQSKVFQIIKTR